MTYIVTVFDYTATKENPVKPINVVVSAENLTEFISQHVDENHSVLVAPIDSRL